MTRVFSSAPTRRACRMAGMIRCIATGPELWFEEPGFLPVPPPKPHYRARGGRHESKLRCMVRRDAHGRFFSRRRSEYDDAGVQAGYRRDDGFHGPGGWG